MGWVAYKDLSETECQPPMPYPPRFSELVKLQNLVIISHTIISMWAISIVPLFNQRGKLRIRGDHKITLNQACTTDSYLLLKVDNLFVNIEDSGKGFLV